MIFFDTGAWIAVSDKSDQYHKEAVAIYVSLKQQRQKFLTIDYVIDETATRLKYDVGHRIAADFLNMMSLSEKSGVLEIFYIEKRIFEEAISIFHRYNDVVLSFTDCVSFAVCQRKKIRKAFAVDHHFTIMGISLYQI
jgi:predicted nucleic acid-binding protein